LSSILEVDLHDVYKRIFVDAEKFAKLSDADARWLWNTTKNRNFTKYTFSLKSQHDLLRVIFAA
jgi:hypothetical protein